MNDVSNHSDKRDHSSRTIADLKNDRNTSVVNSPELDKNRFIFESRRDTIMKNGQLHFSMIVDEGW